MNPGARLVDRFGRPFRSDPIPLARQLAAGLVQLGPVSSWSLSDSRFEFVVSDAAATGLSNCGIWAVPAADLPGYVGGTTGWAATLDAAYFSDYTGTKGQGVRVSIGFAKGFTSGDRYCLMGERWDIGNRAAVNDYGLHTTGETALANAVVEPVSEEFIRTVRANVTSGSSNFAFAAQCDANFLGRTPTYQTWDSTPGYVVLTVSRGSSGGGVVTVGLDLISFRGMFNAGA